MMSAQGNSNKPIADWQQFLKNLHQADYTGAIDPGEVDGYFGPKTVRATLAFQRANNLPLTGEADASTRTHAQSVAREKDIAASLSSGDSAKSLAEIGPHRRESLRECRPYFVIPLDVGLGGQKKSYPAEREAIRKQINTAITQLAKAGKPVTDIYLLSHGWHRNFFGAVQAYDRLVSRFTKLRRRGVLEHPLDQDKLYSPLFLTLHWHSDPGENDFVDEDGRRSKDSFMRNIQAAFEPIDPRQDAKFITDFEAIFQFISASCAPGFVDSDHRVQSAELMARLKEYRIRYEVIIPVPEQNTDAVPSAVDQLLGELDTAQRLAEKVALIWACYEEADKRKPLENQDEPAQRFGGFVATWKTTFAFMSSVLGLGALLGAIWKISHLGDLTKPLTDYIKSAIPETILLVLAFAMIGWVTLWVIGGIQRKKQSRSTGVFPIVQVLAFIPLFLVAALPLIAFLMVTFLISGPILRLRDKPEKHVRRAAGLSDERIGDRGQAPKSDETASPGFRGVMANWGLGALYKLKESVGRDSRLVKFADTISNQFAFFDMQARAQVSARNACEFLAPFFAAPSEAADAPPTLRETRIHLVGHSFGALLVANLARFMAYQDDASRPQNLHTICLVQGALGASWFEAEAAIHGMVRGSVTNIYSRYDSANGFYFPFSNCAKLAAGYVGLTEVGGKPENPDPNQDAPAPIRPARRCKFFALTSAPDLDAPQFLECPPSQEVAQITYPRLMNLDASTLIYNGPVAAGGGHDDIFKDDVIHLIWSAAKLGVPTAPPPTNP